MLTYMIFGVAAFITIYAASRLGVRGRLSHGYSAVVAGALAIVLTGGAYAHEWGQAFFPETGEFGP